MKKYNKYNGLCIVLLMFLYITHAYAGYTLGSNTITQSGTDNNLSGLAGVSGVAVTTLGGVTYYNIGNRRLNFNGTQIVDGRTERVISTFTSNGYVFRVNGTLTINDFEDKSGDITYFEDVVFHSTYVDNFCCGDFGFRVTQNGTLIMNGGYIRSDSSVYFEKDSRLEITQGGFVTNTTNNTIQMRFFSDDYAINGFFVKNFKFTVAVDALATSTLNGLELFGGAVATSGSLTAGSEYVFEDFASSGFGTDQQIDVNDRNYLTFLNAVNGSDLTVAGVIADSRASGLYRNYKRVKVKIETIDGVAAEGVEIYLRDTDNGNRRNWAAGSQGGDNYAAINFSNDRVYNQTTNAVGETNAFDVLLAALARPVGNKNNAPNTGLNTIDIRGKNNDNTDLFDFHILGYLYSYSSKEKELKGAGNLEFTEVVFNDPNISETNRTTVDAYTDINNLDMLYDRAKSWKVTTANLAFPAIETQLITANGSTLDLGNFDLVVDGTAGSAFSVDVINNIITIKTADLLSGDKFTTVTTSGTVSTANGAQLDFGYTDSTGINKYVRLNNLTAWNVVVVDNSNSGSPTNILAQSNVTGDYRAHFIFGSQTLIRVGLNVAGITFFSEAFPQPDMNFIRSEFTLDANEENQNRMLYLAEKILLKEEGISESLRATTPNGTINVTISNTASQATLENQVMLIELLKRIFLKTSTTREVLEQD